MKGDAEPDGAIPAEKLNDVQKFLYREYPDWMLLDDKMWIDLEKDIFGNFSLSPEESRILHPEGGEMRFPLFINGRAGSGKSTVLQYIYADYIARYATAGAEAGKPPAYFACNRELIRTAKELVRSILLHNPKYCVGDSADAIKALVNDEESFEKSFRVYHDYLLSLVEVKTRNRFFPERRYLDYARFTKKWEEKFGRTQNARRDYGADISWHVIRTYIKGMSMGDILDLSDYGNIAQNQQSVSAEVYERVFKNVWEAWYRDLTDYECGESYWDDQDLVRYVLDNDLLPSDGDGFLGVFCDESQDFTHIELESFLRMSVYFERSIYPHEISKLPFVFAGDPYQTLNPTGFRWEAVKAAFTEKFIFGICPIADKVQTDFTLADLQNNYRSIPNIVRFGNSVQLLRGAKFQIPDLKPQLEWKADVARPISYFPADDEHFWRAMLSREGVHIIVPCHANEEFQFIENDVILKEHVQIDQKSGTTTPPVFSAVRAKGLEFPCVIVYGFGQSLPDAKLLDMRDRATDEEREKFLPYEYFLNRLYVAVSRPRSQLYVVDTELGWKNLWRFAESLDALKGIQQKAPHNYVWNEHLEPIQEGTSDHLDSDFEYNPEELAERYEKTGLAESDPAMMNYAARYYQECKGKNEKVVECLAMGLLFNKDYGGAARKFTEIRNYAKAGECWWECGDKNGWKEMEDLLAHDPKLRMDPKYPVARALSQEMPETAMAVMGNLVKLIHEAGAEQFQSEKWVAAVTALVELAVSNKGDVPSAAMQSILELVESGVCNSSETFAEAMLESGDVQRARRFYEFAGVSKGAKYQRTMFVTTEYPACLSYFNVEDMDTRRDAIDRYLQNRDVTLMENSWRYAISAAFIKERRIDEVVDVIAEISDQTTLRSLAGLTSDSGWKSRLQTAAEVMLLRTQPAEIIVREIIASFEKNSGDWFLLRVLARVANDRKEQLENQTREQLRRLLRQLNMNWRKVPLSNEEREKIVPVGEFGLALEKFGHPGDAAGFYKWYYNLTKDGLVARRWFELQTQALNRKHGREASEIRNAIDKFARETGMRPVSSHSASELFSFGWDSLLKGIFARVSASEVEQEKHDMPPVVKSPEAVPEKMLVPQTTPEPRPVVPLQSESEPEPVSEKIETTPRPEDEAVGVVEKMEMSTTALKLTFFSAKGRLNIEDQESGSQWSVNANGVSIDGVPHGHVNKMKIEGTCFSVSTSVTQIVLSDDRCGYEFTIKL